MSTGEWKQKGQRRRLGSEIQSVWTKTAKIQCGTVDCVCNENEETLAAVAYCPSA